MHTFDVQHSADQVLLAVQADFHSHFRTGAGHSLAAQLPLTDSPAQQLGDLLLGIVVIVNHQQIGVRIAEADECHGHQDHTDAQHNRQGVYIQFRSQQYTHCQRPEHVGRIHGILHCRTETHNTEGAHHTHAQGDIALDTHNHRRGNQRQHHQRHGEGRAVQHAAVAAFIHESNDQADDAAHHQADDDLPGRQILKLAEKIIAQAGIILQD